MPSPNHATEELIIPVAGAGNCGGGRLSTAAFHLALWRHSLGHKSGRVVAQPIVPTGFGIFKPLDETYERFVNQLGELTDTHPDAAVVLVGHSLGGLLARRRAAEQPRAFRGVVTLGSPHQGLNPAVRGHIRDEYDSFAASIPPIKQNGGRAARLAFIGSSHDKLVPLSSSLADVPQAERNELSWDNHLPIMHNTLPVAQCVLRLTAQLVESMIEGDTAAVPPITTAPDLLPLPHSA